MLWDGEEYCWGYNAEDGTSNKASSSVLGDEGYNWGSRLKVRLEATCKDESDMCGLGRFDWDFLSQCPKAQAESDVIDLNGLHDALIIIL